MNQIVKLDPSQFGIEESKATQIAEQFKPMLEKMVELEKEYNEIVQLPVDKETCAKAKALRLKYVKVRTGTAEIHKQQKAFYLAAGRYIDGWKNAQLFASEGIETKLESIEKHLENIERERLAKLKADRIAVLAEIVEMPENYNSETLTEDAFQNLVEGLKLAKEAKEKAEREAEEARIAKEKAEAEERERIRIENERLKAEAEEKERQLAAERAEQERKERELREKHEAELKAKEAEAKAERDRIAEVQRKADEKAKREREEVERIAREAQAELEAERKRIADELKAKEKAEQDRKDKESAAEEARLSMGDAEKFDALISDIQSLIGKYEFKSAKFKKAKADVETLLQKTVEHANSKK
jgi:hypothetical protein